MASLDVKFELVTPAFAGAAKRGETDGLRIPEIKALLRFWWRTMNGHLLIPQLRKEEAALFGSSDAKVGRRLSLVPKGGSIGRVDRAPTSERDQLYTYFAYGPVTRSEIVTPRVHPGAWSTITFVTSKNSRINAIDELAKTLWLVSAFAGYGGRSRRGWGSLRVSGVGTEWTRLGLSDPHSQSDPTNLARCLAQGLKVCTSARSSLAGPAATLYSAFSSGSRLVLGRSSSSMSGATQSWKAALEKAATLFRDYRQTLGAPRGHGPRVGPDFEKRASWSAGARPTDSPLGSAFGLPHNAKFNVGVGVGARSEGRRASPLFMKVLRVGAQDALPVFLWLPAEFLPTSLPIVASVGGRRSTIAYAGDSAIHEFFDGGTISQGTGQPKKPWKGVSKLLDWQEVSW